MSNWLHSYHLDLYRRPWSTTWPKYFEDVQCGPKSDCFTVRLHNARYCCRNSVRLSVRQRACIVTKLNDALWILWYHTKRQSLQLSDTNICWWAMPSSLSNIRRMWPTPFEKRRLQQISAHNVSTVGDDEKKFNYDECEVDHGLSNEL